LADQPARSLDHTPDRERREAAEGENVVAISHAQPGEIIDVRPLGPALAGSRTTALVKTESLEVIRMVIPPGKEVPTHSTLGEITVLCLEGRVAFTTGGVTRELGAGQLLFLQGEQPHSVLGIEAASLLVTITFPRDSPIGERPAHP